MIDVINHYKDIQNIFTLILDSIMEKLHIRDKTSKQKKNIFDELAAMVEIWKLNKINNKPTKRVIYE